MPSSRSMLAAAALLLAATPALAQAPAYSAPQSAPLGAPDRWDYLTFDAAGQRVYVAHGDRITVVDAHSGQVLGEVLGIPGGTHGIGLSGGKGYTDDGAAGQVIVFDPASFKILKRIPAKPDADGITVDPATGHVFVVEGDSHAVAVVDPASDTVIADIDTSAGLEFAVAGPGGKVYVNGAERREIIRIDTATNRIDARWPIPGCESPHGLAIDPVAHRLFSTCKNKVMTAINTDTGAVAGIAPIGAGTDAAAFDPQRRLAFSSNGEGTITAVREAADGSIQPAATIKTQATGRTMTIDPQSGRLYVVAAKIDAAAPPPAAGHGKPKLVPGSLKLLMLDPAS